MSVPVLLGSKITKFMGHLVRPGYIHEILSNTYKMLNQTKLIWGDNSAYETAVFNLIYTPPLEYKFSPELDNRYWTKQIIHFPNFHRKQEYQTGTPVKTCCQPYKSNSKFKRNKVLQRSIETL
jgi:hypothetical protein